MATGDPAAEAIRVLICDDYFLIREGLKIVLSRQADIEVVGEAETGEDAVELADSLLPDVVIMDILLPGMDGMQATRLIKDAHPSVAVIALTRYDDSDHIMQIYRSGASAYLKKSVKADELVNTLRVVQNGGVVLHPHVADSVIQSFGGVAGAPLPTAAAGLSSREMDVLRLVAQGHSNKEIARLLGISARTAQNHMANILRKLEVNDRVAAAVYAISQGLAGPDPSPTSPQASRSRVPAEPPRSGS